MNDAMADDVGAARNLSEQRLQKGRDCGAGTQIHVTFPKGRGRGDGKLPVPKIVETALEAAGTPVEREDPHADSYLRAETI